jgi:hypothetical protein
MRNIRLIFLLAIILIPIGGVGAQEIIVEAEITSPTAGDAIRGIVPVRGTNEVDGFQSWELTFSYTRDTTGTWFFISEGDETITDGTLSEWDTTTLTDGSYNLRLTVFLEGGRRTHFITPDLRVRNYTPIETSTPIPTLTSTPFTVTPKPSLTPTITQSPTETLTLTPLPTNPIEITNGNVSNSLMRGAAGALAAFLIIGLYTTLRKVFRK